MNKFIFIAFTLSITACGHHKSSDTDNSNQNQNFVPNPAPVLPPLGAEKFGLVNSTVIHQGTWGDDWLLITMASLATNNPAVIVDNLTAGSEPNTWNVVLYDHGTQKSVGVNLNDITNPNAQYAATEPTDIDGNIVLWPRIYEAAFLNLNNQDPTFLVYNTDKDVLDGSLPSYAIAGLINQQASNVEISGFSEATLWSFTGLASENVIVLINTKSTLPPTSALRANHSYWLVSSNQSTDTLVVFDPALINSNNGQFEISMSDIISDVDNITAPNVNLPTAYVNE